MVDTSACTIDVVDTYQSMWQSLHLTQRLASNEHTCLGTDCATSVSHGLDKHTNLDADLDATLGTNTAACVSSWSGAEHAPPFNDL